MKKINAKIEKLDLSGITSVRELRLLLSTKMKEISDSLHASNIDSFMVDDLFTRWKEMNKENVISFIYSNFPPPIINTTNLTLNELVNILKDVTDNYLNINYIAVFISINDLAYKYAENFSEKNKQNIYDFISSADIVISNSEFNSKDELEYALYKAMKPYIELDRYVRVLNLGFSIKNTLIKKCKAIIQNLNLPDSNFKVNTGEKHILNLKLGKFNISGKQEGYEYPWKEYKDNKKIISKETRHRTEEYLDMLGIIPITIYTGWQEHSYKSTYVLAYYNNEPIIFSQKQTNSPMAGQYKIYSKYGRIWASNSEDREKLTSKENMLTALGLNKNK